MTGLADGNRLSSIGSWSARDFPPKSHERKLFSEFSIRGRRELALAQAVMVMVIGADTRL